MKENGEKLFGKMNKKQRFDFDNNRWLKLLFAIFFLILSIISIGICTIILYTPINNIYNKQTNDYYVNNLLTFSCFIPAFFVLSYVKWISWEYFISF